MFPVYYTNDNLNTLGYFPRTTLSSWIQIIYLKRLVAKLVPFVDHTEARNA